MEWQPIETAPKDGTVIILCESGYRDSIRASFWRQDGDGFPWKFLDPDSETFLNGWLGDHRGPTHWMPLPEPPK